MRCKCHGVQLGVLLHWWDSMKRETSGSYPAVDLPDLHIIFSWDVCHVHCSLVSCMPLHMSPTFLFPLFLVWSVCNYQMLWREDKANTVGVWQLFLCVCLPSSLLSCQETSCLFQHLYSICSVPTFPSLYSSLSSPLVLCLLLFSSIPAPLFLCSVLIAYIQVSPSLLPCSLLLHALEVS